MSEPKKHWNHRIMVHEFNGELDFRMHEVHYEDGVPTNYTTHAIRIHGESVEAINWTLDRMKESASKTPLWYGDRFPEEYKPE